MEELIKKVEKWAGDVGILEQGTIEAQYEKVMEEIQEFGLEIYNDNIETAKMELGDVYLSYIVLLKLTDATPSLRTNRLFYLAKNDVEETIVKALFKYRINPVECLQLAYDKVSKRKGKMIDGTFVKEEDLKESE